MKRGLKVTDEEQEAFFRLVATYAPMKRGLKDAFRHPARLPEDVATYAPMKRGLKVHRACLLES